MTAVEVVDTDTVLCIAGDARTVHAVSLVPARAATAAAAALLPGGGEYYRLAVAARSAGAARTAIAVAPDRMTIYRRDDAVGWTVARTIVQRSELVGSVSHLPLPAGGPGLFAIVTDRLYVLDAGAGATTRPVPVPARGVPWRQSSWVFPMQAFAVDGEILLCDNIRGTFFTRDGARSARPELRWTNQPLGFSQLAPGQIAVSGWDSIVVYTGVGTPAPVSTKVHAAPNLNRLGNGVWVSTEPAGSRVFATRPLAAPVATTPPPVAPAVTAAVAAVAAVAPAPAIYEVASALTSEFGEPAGTEGVAIASPTVPVPAVNPDPVAGCDQENIDPLRRGTSLFGRRLPPLGSLDSPIESPERIVVMREAATTC